MAPRVISIASGKGGVGKTTTVANVAVALGRSGLKVLAWDLDGQGNLAQALGVDIRRVGISSYHLLSRRVLTLGPALTETNHVGVSLVAAHMDLFASESELPGDVGKERILHGLLRQPEAQSFDLVLMDLPPNLGFQTLNAFAASRWVVVPLQVSGFALSGLRQVAHAIRLAQDGLNPELELMGVLPTFVSSRTNFSREVVAALQALPGTRVLEPSIPHTVRVAETSLTGVPVVAAAEQSPAARAYIEVARSIWQIARTAPEHVVQAPAPAIAAPPRARGALLEGLVRDLRRDEPRVRPDRHRRLPWFRRAHTAPS